MPKERMQIYGAILLVLAAIGYFRYGGVENDTKAIVPRVSDIQKSVPVVDIEAVHGDEDVGPAEKTKVVSAVSKPQDESTVVESLAISNDIDDEEAEEETPSVKRSQLIGGADVEWIEPKPKDPENKFGEPPM